MESLVKRVTTGMKWNFLGKFTSMLVGLLLTIVIVRNLLPSDYGTYSLLMTIVAFFFLFTSLQLELGLLKHVPELNAKGKANAVRAMVTGALIIRFLLVVVGAFLLYFSAGFLSTNIFKNPDLQFYIRLSSVFIIPFAFSGIFKSFLEAMYEQKFINTIEVTQSFFRLLFIGVLLFLGHGILGILIANFLVDSIVILLLWTKVRKIFSFTFKNILFRTNKLLILSLTLWVTEFGGFLIGKNLDLLLLGMSVESAIVGFYNLAYISVDQSYKLFGLVMGSLTLISASEVYGRRDYKSLSLLFTLFLRYHFFYAIPICIGGIILAQNIVRVLYGENYLPSVIFFKLYFVVLLIGLMGGFMATLLLAVGGYRVLLYSAILGSIKIPIALILIPRYGAFGMVAAATIAIMISLVFLTFSLSKRIKMHFPTFFFIKTLISSLAMTLPVMFFAKYAHTPISLLFTIVLGAATYILVLRFLTPFSKEDLELIRESTIPGKGYIIKFFSK